MAAAAAGAAAAAAAAGGAASPAAAVASPSAVAAVVAAHQKRRPVPVTTSQHEQQLQLSAEIVSKILGIAEPEVSAPAPAPVPVPVQPPPPLSSATPRAAPPKAPPPRHLLKSQLDRAAESAAFLARVSRFERGCKLEPCTCTALRALPQEAIEEIISEPPLPSAEVQRARTAHRIQNVMDGEATVAAWAKFEASCDLGPGTRDSLLLLPREAALEVVREEPLAEREEQAYRTFQRVKAAREAVQAKREADMKPAAMATASSAPAAGSLEGQTNVRIVGLEDLKLGSAAASSSSAPDGGSGKEPPPAAGAAAGVASGSAPASGSRAPSEERWQGNSQYEKLRKKVNALIATRKHSVQSSAEISHFVHEFKLRPELGKALLMLSESSAWGIIKIFRGESESAKKDIDDLDDISEAVLSQVRTIDPEVADAASVMMGLEPIGGGSGAGAGGQPPQPWQGFGFPAVPGQPLWYPYGPAACWPGWPPPMPAAATARAEKKARKKAAKQALKAASKKSRDGGDGGGSRARGRRSKDAKQKRKRARKSSSSGSSSCGPSSGSSSAVLPAFAPRSKAACIPKTHNTRSKASSRAQAPEPLVRTRSEALTSPADASKADRPGELHRQQTERLHSLLAALRGGGPDADALGEAPGGGGGTSPPPAKRAAAEAPAEEALRRAPASPARRRRREEAAEGEAEASRRRRAAVGPPRPPPGPPPDPPPLGASAAGGAPGGGEDDRPGEEGAGDAADPRALAERLLAELAEAEASDGDDDDDDGRPPLEQQPPPQQPQQPPSPERPLADEEQPLCNDGGPPLASSTGSAGDGDEGAGQAAAQQDAPSPASPAGGGGGSGGGLPSDEAPAPCEAHGGAAAPPPPLEEVAEEAAAEAGGSEGEPVAEAGAAAEAEAPSVPAEDDAEPPPLAAADSEEETRVEALRKWLLSLDNGKGAMLQYGDVLKGEFDADFAQIGAVRLAEPVSPGVIGSIDPFFWEVCGIKPMGHRLLFARGLNAL